MLLKSCVRADCGIPEVLDDEGCADDNDALRFGTGDVRSWGVKEVWGRSLGGFVLS